MPGDSPHPFTTSETAVLNEAEHAGMAFLAAVESNVIQPILGVLAGKLGWLAPAP